MNLATLDIADTLAHEDYGVVRGILAIAASLVIPGIVEIMDVRGTVGIVDTMG